MKKLSLLSILLFPILIFAQDIIYTVSGEINEEKVTLNAIHFENISNGTGILFDSLPDVDDYQINLTQKKYWGTTNIEVFEKPSKFAVLQNIPGKLVVQYNGSQPADLRISVYNINGQKVFSSGKQILQEKNSINIQLGLPHLFLVKFETVSGSQTFKAIGSENRNGYNAEISDESNLNVLKSTLAEFDNEFSFSVGDSIRISAYKSGYYAEPIDLKVTNSESMNFLFEESQQKNYLKINENDYVLSGGLLTYFGNFEGNSSLYLLAPGHDINFETLETTGTDAVVLFEIINAQEDIASGVYYLGTPEEMNTDTVCDVDVNNDGIINEQDCVYKLPEGKFYISSRSSVYDDDVNLHNFAGLKFQSGKVIITKDEDFFTVEFDCIGKNDDVITGFYSGQIHYYNVADEPFETDSFTDSRDGKTYKTVKIGDQWWMAENLAYLPFVRPNSLSSLTNPYFYIYGYNGENVYSAKETTNFDTYGVLYNWPAAKEACPEGWHLPTDNEWKQLESEIGINESELDNKHWRGTDEGEKLKANYGWSYCANCTNDYGFSALPGGCVIDGDIANNIGMQGAWWTADENEGYTAWYRMLDYSESGIYRHFPSRSDGLSVRCVKDMNSTLIESETEIVDTLLWCYSKLHEYVEFTYLFDAVYSNNYPAPDNFWTEIYNHELSPDNVKILRLWSDTYDIIYKSNLVIKSAEDAISDPQTRNTIVAQAKTMRAYLFHNLLTWFGEIPLEGGISESMIPRNTKGEVLEQIKQDAAEAAQSLPMSWAEPDKFKFPKSFAWGLMARASLFNKNYTEALPPVQNIINSGFYALDEDTINFSTTSTEIFCGFEKSDDTEFNDFFTKGSFVPVMRYTESYLIYAESLINTGDTVSALNFINQINMQRDKPFVDSLTDDDLYQHWETELVKEGSMFITLKRFGKALSVLQISENKLVLPIPLPVLENNPYLIQNSGY